MNKKNISIIFILFFAHNAFSQDTLYKENAVWIGEISNGKRNGYCYEYKNDTLLSEGYFKNDIKEEGEYIHRKKEGEWRKYASEGGLSAIENYKDDKLHGEYVRFNWYDKYVWHYGYFENGERVK